MNRAETSGSTRFGLLRHAETIWNRQKRIQGRMDSPLTETGVETCRRWGALLASSGWSWDRIVCSPSPRARESARIINQPLGIDIETADNLREQDWGSWEGRTMDELRHEFGDELSALEQSGWDFRAPSGESRREVRQRARAALEGCVERYPGEQILVITHQGVIKSLIYAIEDRQFLPGEPRLIKKNRLHTIRWHNHRFSADTYNINLPEHT